jgi:hypothetical protein
MGSQLGGWPDGKNATQISRNSEVDRGSACALFQGGDDQEVVNFEQIQSVVEAIMSSSNQRKSV